MRFVFLVFAAALAACEAGAPSSDLAGGSVDGYTIEIRASEAQQTYIVTAPNGERVAARAAGGASALMDSEDLRALAAEAPLADDANLQEQVSLRMPGIDLSVRADPDAASGDGGGRVSMNIGGQAIEVDASDQGAGTERADIRIGGMDEADVRAFITKADGLSPAVQAQMLAELGLE
jgi:hypothetical protein